MQFIVRLVEALTLGVAVFATLLITVIVVVFVFNRGLQLFLEVFGYEVGDFFGWFMNKIGFQKKKK